MNRLLVNTANEKLFIVLEKENSVFSSTNTTQAHHNEVMLPLIDKLLKDNNVGIEDIDEFGVVEGPGSFTGIRVGISTIKAFRDALKVRAKGVNNLDYLYALANVEKNVETVAILGSKDSYFVAKNIHNILYKFDRNLTKKELIKLSEGKTIGMFKKEKGLNCFEVKDNAKTLLNCFLNSQDETLVPVYYQLSQAENEKLKRGKLTIKKANKKDKSAILEIEKNNILTNQLKEQDIENALVDKNYKTIKAVFNENVVGFVVLQVTDEVNVVSIAVEKGFRNLGIATKLLKRAEAEAKRNKVESISLEVSYNNITAFLLYTKLGYKLRRIRKNYYSDGADCLEMVKDIQV